MRVSHPGPVAALNPQLQNPPVENIDRNFKIWALCFSPWITAGGSISPSSDLQGVTGSDSIPHFFLYLDEPVLYSPARIKPFKLYEKEEEEKNRWQVLWFLSQTFLERSSNCPRIRNEPNFLIQSQSTTPKHLLIYCKTARIDII